MTGGKRDPEAWRRVRRHVTLTHVCRFLTLPPPGVCFMLSLEPQRDWTLDRSSFLSRICTWGVRGQRSELDAVEPEERGA